MPVDVVGHLKRAADYAARRGLTVLSMTELADDPDRDRRACALDNALRQDISGTEGWAWSYDAFLDELYASGFDPGCCFVAVGRNARYVCLLRIWMNPSGLRLGLIAVLRSAPARRTVPVSPDGLCKCEAPN